ncbi:MAG: amidohydrolase family protein [Brevinema sp.]
MAFIIKNVSILVSALEGTIINGASIKVVDGIINKISQTEINPLEGEELIDGNNNLLIPGMVNAHTHASMSLFRGLGEGRRDRLTKFFFPLEKQCVSSEVVFLAGLYGLQEMLTHGITAFCDMYYFEDEVGKAAEVLGMRGVIGQTIVNFPAPDAPKSYGGLELAHCSAEKWKNHQLIKFAYAPHAPYTVEPHILKEVNNSADQNNALVTMHVAEFEDEWARINAISDIRENETVIAYLERHGVIRDHSIYAHNIFVTKKDIEILQAHHIHIAHCPIANAKGGKGIAPIYDMKQHNMTIGLATDGPLSGNRLSLRDVVSYTYVLAKLRGLDPTHLLSNEVFHFATKGGYDALSIVHGGEIKEGYKADFTLLDMTNTGLVPNYDTISNLVLSVSDRAFLATWVNGVKVAENGIPINCDWGIYQKEIQKMIHQLSKIVVTL